jgi:UDP-N-acetylglucosamine 4,6-dehydratase/5-epimerase
MLPKGSRVLITGACGSVGTALVSCLLKEGHTVCAFDQSEDGLFRLDQKFKKSFGSNLRSFLGNVRDVSRLSTAFEGVRFVIHCAALKHVYISEYNPFEAMQTNIEGVQNVIRAAITNNVEKVLLTSSDKAVNPTSTMGATKLLGERLFVAANHYSGIHNTRFSCVRFGNVLNSNGSVVKIFKKQIENGQPLTITSPRMTRFFISMDQAVDLCTSSLNKMVGGEVFVLSMGSADIMTIAKAVTNGKPFQHIEIGLKPGEKLYEELVTESEAPRTACDGVLNVILPETIEMLPESIRDQYKKYEKLPFLKSSLRSDENLLSKPEVQSLLAKAELLLKH